MKGVVGEMRRGFEECPLCEGSGGVRHKVAREQERLESLREAARAVVKNACSYGSGQLLYLVESELIDQLAERLEALDE